jgi:hypothetical protein
VLDLGNACSGFSEEELEELRDIARLYASSTGLVMKLANWVGNRAEDITQRLPAGWQERLGEATELALRTSYRLAETTHQEDGGESIKDRAMAWASGERWHTVTASVAGAAGGWGGLATTLAELPVTTTIILRSIQQIALGYGEDISDEEVRTQCLAVFGLGGPLEDDDEAETGLFASRMAMTGKGVAEMLKAVLPRFGIPVSQKVLAQATPVIGAAVGAGLNKAFVEYYQGMAHVHFRLRRLEAGHDQERVRACFERIAKSQRKRKERN